MINTQLVDTRLFMVSVSLALFTGNYFYRTRKVNIKLVPLLLLTFMGFWCAQNMVGHLIAVWWVNILRMQEGTFSYNLHFYNL